MRGRVLQVVADGGLGGGTTHVVQVLEGLGTTFEVGLVTQSGSHAAVRAQQMGVPFLPANLFSKSPWELARFWAAVESFRPDLVHAHGSRAAFWCGLLLPRQPRIYTVHGYHFLHRRDPMRWLGRIADRQVSARASQIVFVSNYDARLARSEDLVPPQIPTTVVYNGVPLPSTDTLGASGSKRIGFIGRLVPQKAPDLFLDVLSLLPDHHGVLVGSGVLRESLESEAARRRLSQVEFMGSVEPKRVADVMATLEVLVIPSRWEGFPYLVLEAFRAGLPVVSAKVGGIPEIIEDGVSGCLIDTRDPSAYAAAVRKLTSDPQMWESTARAARKSLTERFSQERMLAQLQDLYERLLGQSPLRMVEQHE